ncbi:hypothetical protein BYT27DRAFT_7341850 [Phlegmacium glaucopus]|nr:hypothetical protein BYT27DRAFT_7341850 [Phlegmacium glaucopus]
MFHPKMQTMRKGPLVLSKGSIAAAAVDTDIAKHGKPVLATLIILDMIASLGHVLRSRDLDREPPHPHNQASPSGDYYRDTKLTYNYNLKSQSWRQSAFAQEPFAYWGSTATNGIVRRSTDLGGGPGSATGSDYGYMPMTMIPQMGNQNTGSHVWYDASECRSPQYGYVWYEYVWKRWEYEWFTSWWCTSVFTTFERRLATTANSDFC